MTIGKKEMVEKVTIGKVEMLLNRQHYQSEVYILRNHSVLLRKDIIYCSGKLREKRAQPFLLPVDSPPPRNAALQGHNSGKGGIFTIGELIRKMA